MRVAACLLVVFLTLAAAAGGVVFVTHARAAPDKAVRIKVTERDFRISAPKRVSSGDLLVSVANKGPDDHELIVVRAPSAHLPLRSDGLTVNEEKLTPVTEPGLEPGAPNSTRELQLHLPPGRYVLFCNMSGHFMAGMHTTLVVR